jgi:hypothetical protein
LSPNALLTTNGVCHNAASRKKSEAEKLAEEEKKLLEAMTQDIPLQSVADRAHGVVYTEALTTSYVHCSFCLLSMDILSSVLRL